MGARAYRYMETGRGVKLRAVAFGAGNVASHLVPALAESAGLEFVAVWSRTAEHANALAERIGGSMATTEINEVPKDADVYLIMAADDMVARIAEQFPRTEALWMHTSGSVAAQSLACVTSNYGVLYPLQTFTRGEQLDISDVPFFVEGSNEKVVASIMEVARAVSRRVYEADSEMRSKMHVAAVFACNFANYMWSVADGMLRRDANLDISVLEPLLHETLRKAMSIGPSKAQTGPARRGDVAVMEKHKSMLPEDERMMYDYLSKKILEKYYK